MMFKKTLKALGATALFITAGVFQANAQIAEEFECVDIVTGKSYTPITGNTHQKTSFKKPPQFVQDDPDDGYVRVSLGFDYEFNGTTYQQIYVCVNGFITFSNPLALSQEDPTALFKTNATSFQNNVIAPYWGDHYYRNIQDLPNGFQPGAIKTELITDVDGNGNRAFVVEWNNIQINDETIESSVGNFQVWLYESTDANSDQGSIEFAYGQIGPTNPQVQGQVVITKGASIGIKGSNGDFVNGLRFVAGGGTDANTCSQSKTDAITLTDQWQPSGGTDRRIRLSANVIFRLEETWGDGDADLSKAPGSRHAQFFLQQNRYVTMNDIREILVSVATSTPLDPVRRRNAYHADVNHDGRYFWRNNPPGTVPARTRVEIPVRSMFYNQDLPNEITTLNQIFYQADEEDASMIVQYLNARLPELPWIYDWKTTHGDKKAEAASISFGELNRRDANLVEVPVYLDSDHQGPLSMRLDLNGKVLNISSADGTVVEFSGNRVVLAGEGEFTSDEPIFTALVEATGDVVAEGVRFNGNVMNSLTSSTEEQTDMTLDVAIFPNPVVETATFTVEVPTEGNYSLDVYNQNGTLVKNIVDANLSADTYSFEWNGMDSRDANLAEGLYIFRLSGQNGVNITKTLIIGK